jgi:hypothetical protein
MSQLSSASYGGGGGGAVSTAGGSVPSAGEAMSLASSAPEVPGDAAAGDATAAGEQAGSSTNLAPIIHINVEGHVVDEDDFARKIYNSLEKAKADGIMR